MGWKWTLAQTLELWWWQRYLRKQSPTAYLAWKQSYWQRLIQVLPSAIWPATGAKILEAGCGPAGIFTVLPDYTITAIDPLLKSYAQELMHFEPGDWPYTHFYPSTIEDWQVKEKYPLVLSFNAINHVRNWEKALQQLTAATQDDGWLVMSSDVHKRKWTKRLFRTLPGDALHPQQHTKHDYLKALQDLNWSIRWEMVHQPGRIFDYWLVSAQKNPAN